MQKTMHTTLQTMQTNSMLQLSVLFTLLMTLTACSKQPEYADASAATGAEVQTDAAIPATDQLRQRINSQDKPELLMSEQINAVEKSRPMVKTATISFEVKDVYQTALQLEQLANDFAGFIEQKNIQKQLEDQIRRNNTGQEGTQTVYSKIRPHASMIVRIPSAQTQRFINTLPKFMLFLNEQRYEAKRLELKLLQEKLAQQSTAASAPTRTASPLATEIAQLTRQEVVDRLHYSTIELDFNQPATVRQTQDIDLHLLAKQQDGFLTRLWHAMVLGGVGFMDFIVTAMLLWPLWLVLLIAGSLIWNYKKRRGGRVVKIPENQDI